MKPYSINFFIKAMIFYSGEEKVLILLRLCLRINHMLAFLIIIFGFLSRIVVHTPNFSPVLSLALFGGTYLKGRQAIWVPMVLMALSDAVLGFHDTMVFTWGSILVISLIGSYLCRHNNWANVLSASIFSSLFFFVVTNFGAFLSLYPHTLAGLQQCYILAIPFYQSTLVSTVAYSLVLYIIYEWALKNSTGTVLARLV